MAKKKGLGQIETALGVVGVIGLAMFGYYATGIYVNLKRIKKENLAIKKLDQEIDNMDQCLSPDSKT